MHVLETDRHDEAEDFRRYLQYENGFLNAWILADISWGDIPSDGDGHTSESNMILELYTGGAVLLSSSDNSHISIIKNQAQTRESPGGGAVRAFTFVAKTVRGVTIPAKVLLMDRKGRSVSTFKTGEVVSFGGKHQEQVLTLVCQAPGYNTETRVIALNKLGELQGVAQNKEGLWAIRFEMTKLRINKVDLLYQRAFYSDAAVLQPETKHQIDVLISMMQANPGLRVEINSHCNAGKKREIMLARNQSLFDLSEATSTTASDKQLTRHRAETLRDYLIEQRIDSNQLL